MSQLDSTVAVRLGVIILLAAGLFLMVMPGNGWWGENALTEMVDASHGGAPRVTPAPELDTGSALESDNATMTRSAGAESESLSGRPDGALDSIETDAWAFVRSYSLSGDGGVQHTCSLIRQALEPPGGLDAFAAGLPTAEAILNDPSVHSTGATLAAEERRLLEEMIGDYGARIRTANRDAHVCVQLALGEKLLAGECAEKPNGSDPGRVFAREDAAALLRNPGSEYIISSVPGVNLGSRRVVVIEGERFRRCASAQQRPSLLRAEFDLAVRSLLYGAARRSGR